MSNSKKPIQVLAIDPGPTETAYVDLKGDEIRAFAKVPNEQVLQYLAREHANVVIEMVACYGMPCGHEVFDTCVWIGQFKSVNGCTPRRVDLMFRRDVKLHWCGNLRAKDSNVRQAVIDAYGGKDKAIGRKATPGLLYGIKADCWQALALGLAWQAKEHR